MAQGTIVRRSLGEGGRYKAQGRFKVPRYNKKDKTRMRTDAHLNLNDLDLYLTSLSLLPSFFLMPCALRLHPIFAHQKIIRDTDGRHSGQIKRIDGLYF